MGPQAPCVAARRYCSKFSMPLTSTTPRPIRCEAVAALGPGRLRASRCGQCHLAVPPHQPAAVMIFSPGRIDHGESGGRQRLSRAPNTYGNCRAGHDCPQARVLRLRRAIDRVEGRKQQGAILLDAPFAHANMREPKGPRPVKRCEPEPGWRRWGKRLLKPQRHRAHSHPKETRQRARSWHLSVLKTVIGSATFAR